MTRAQAMSWVDRISPGNWITIIIVILGLVASLSVSGFRTEEDSSRIKENIKSIQKNAADIQEIRGDYRVILERLNQSKETDARIEKKLDELMNKK